jgi:hypothetical protein
MAEDAVGPRVALQQEWNVSQPRAARYPYRTIEFNRRVIASPICSPLRPVDRSIDARIAARTGMVLRIAMWTGPKIPNFVCMAGSPLKRREPMDDKHDHTSGPATARD